MTWLLVAWIAWSSFLLVRYTLLSHALQPEKGRLWALIIGTGMAVWWPLVLVERFSKFERWTK